MSASVDHIVPVSKNGHPSDMSNLQLAHRACYRQKSDKIFSDTDSKPRVLSNRNLPQSADWAAYKNGQEPHKKTSIKIKLRKNIGSRFNDVQARVNQLLGVGKQKMTKQLADEVERGLHGNGDDRKRSLGNRYDEVQREFNRRYK